MYGNCHICGERFGMLNGESFELCEHMLKEAKRLKKEADERRLWSSRPKEFTMHKRDYPDRDYGKIVTQKARFFGQLMYSVLIAGGHPSNFTYQALRNKTLETVLDNFLPNDMELTVKYTKKHRIGI